MKTTCASAATTTTAAAASHSATMATIEVWYILIDSDNVPVGPPSMVILGSIEKIFHLKTAIKNGEYQNDITYVNTKDMEVWRFEDLRLHDANMGGIDVNNLDFTHAGKNLGAWLRVAEQNIQEDEPLVVRVVQKGVQHSFLCFRSAELSYFLNS